RDACCVGKKNRKVYIRKSTPYGLGYRSLPRKRSAKESDGRDIARIRGEAFSDPPNPASLLPCTARCAGWGRATCRSSPTSLPAKWKKTTTAMHGIAFSRYWG